jgi:uncharacterized protein YecT (DUF1311 family)
MPTSVMRTIEIVVFVLSTLPTALAQDRPRKISEEDIQRFVAPAPDCEVSINNLEYFDFTGDGVDEAIVVASTCSTGTAGPDVHAVLTRRPDGSMAELKIHRPDKMPGALLGRSFNDLNVDDGRLVETFHDTSGRDKPLVITYRWNPKDNEFQSADVKAAPRYKASFDCDKAKTEVENAICYSQDVAFLDGRVAAAYQSWLNQLNNADSDKLIEEQKAWLRKRNVICGLDWQIVDCLETLYRARLLEVYAFRSLHE